MSQWYPNQQQWVGGVPAQFNQPQQQGAGWPGQWQQQPTPPPPHQQQGGYYGPRPPQGGFPQQQFGPAPQQPLAPAQAFAAHQQQQFPTPHQFGPTPQQPMAPAQAFAAHQQQLQAMQQKQLAEQQRLAREEQRRREFEIQKRRLQHINVVKPAAANPVDDLFGKKLHSAPLSQTGATLTGVSPTPMSSASTLPPPPPPPPPSQQPPVVLSSEQPQGHPSSQAASSEQKGSTESGEKREVQHTKPDPAETYQKLMADSLSNLSKPAASTRKKMEFKTSTTHLKSSQRAPKPVPQSVKSREWCADTSEFAGMFAVHTQQQEAQEDDGFGEFQSSVDRSGLLEQGEFQAAPLLKPQQPLRVQPPPSNQSGLGQGSFVPGQAAIMPPPSLSTVTLTSSYTRPIVATSVSGPVSDTITSHGQTSIGASSETRGIGFQTHGSSSATSIETVPSTIVPSKPPSSVPITLDPSRFPPVYQEVYKRCSTPGDPFLRTELLFPILTSSELPRNVLRDLWTLANKSVPGKLNQTEMFVLLGLIGLAQSGHPSPSLEALKHAPHPPIPRLSALPEFTSTTLGPPPPSENLQTADDDFGEFHGTAPPPSSGPLPSNPPLPIPPLPQQPTGPPLPQQPTGPPLPQQPTGPPLPQQQTGPPLPQQPTGPPLPQQPTGPPLPQQQTGPPLPLQQTGPSLPQQPTGPSLPQQPTGLPLPQQPTDPSLPQQPTGPPLPQQQTGPPLPQQQTVPPKTEPVEMQFPAQSVLKPSVDDSVKIHDKYSAFEELRGVSLISVGQDASSSYPGEATVSTAVTQPPKDEYSAFNELGPLSSSQAGQGASLPSMEDTFQVFASGPPPPPSTNVDIPQPLLPSSLGASVTKPLEGSSSLPSVSNDIDDFTAFADFTSAQIAHVPVTSTVIGITSATDITSFGSSSQERSTDDNSWADFSQFSTIQLTDPLTNTAVASTVEIPRSEASGVPGSSAISTTAEAKPTLGDEEEKKPRSKSLGLEILEEELEGDITQPPPAPVDLSQPLVPETVSHVKAGDEFGEFEAYGGSQKTHTQTKKVEKQFPSTVWKPPAKVDPVRVLATCLTKCGEVLEQSASVFAGVQESSLLREICEVEEGRNKLRGIVEVYRLAKRVFCSLKHTDPDAVDTRQVESIYKHWKTLVNTLPNNIMEMLYSQMASTKTKEESDVLSDTISKCSLCLLPKDVTIPPSLSLDGREEEYHLPLLFHQGQSYHATCANFWCNAVLEELPVP